MLLTLSAIGESTQAELAELGAVEQSTMALTLRRMERDGLIQRIPDPTDRRRAIVRLSTKAQDLLPSIEAIATAINASATRHLSGGTDLLLEQLTQIADNLRNVDAVTQAAAARTASS